MKNTNVKRRVKSNRKGKILSRVYLSAVAIILATASGVFCFISVKNSNFFSINNVQVYGIKVYTDEYIIEQSGINLGKNLFSVDCKEVAKKIEQEIYIKKCKVQIKIPNKVCIYVLERKEKYKICYNDKKILVDDDGVCLDVKNEDINNYNDLLILESNVDIIYNIGNKVNVDGIEKINKVTKLMNFVSSLPKRDRVTKICFYEDNIIMLDTKYGLNVKMYLDDKVNDNYNKALYVTKLRLKNNEKVAGGLIDFTKSSNMIFEIGYIREGT